MALRGALRDDQPGGDLPVRHALGDQPGDLALARRERGRLGRRGRRRGDGFVGHRVGHRLGQREPPAFLEGRLERLVAQLMPGPVEGIRSAVAGAARRGADDADRVAGAAARPAQPGRPRRVALRECRAGQRVDRVRQAEGVAEALPQPQAFPQVPGRLAGRLAGQRDECGDAQRVRAPPVLALARAELAALRAQGGRPFGVAVPQQHRGEGEPGGHQELGVAPARFVVPGQGLLQQAAGLRQVVTAAQLVGGAHVGRAGQQERVVQLAGQP